MISGGPYRYPLRTWAMVIIAFLLPVDMILFYYEDIIPITLQKVVSGPLIFAAALSLPWRWLRGSHVILLWCFFVLVAVSGYAAYYRAAAIGFVQSVAINVLLVMALVNLVRREEDLRLFLRAYLFSTGVAGALAVLQSYTGEYYLLTEMSWAWRYGGDPGTGLARAAGLSNEINYFATYQGVGMAVWLFLPKKNVIDRLAGIATTAGLVYSFSRMGLVILFVLCAWRLWRGIRTPGRKIAVVLVMPIVALLCVETMPYLERTRVVTRISARLTVAQLTERSAAVRRDSTLEGLRLAVENPLIGIGPGNQPYVGARRGYLFAYAHNTWVSMAVDSGIPAVLLLAGLMLFPLAKVLAGGKLLPMANGSLTVRDTVLAIIVAMLLASMFLVLQYNRVFYAVIALAVAFVKTGDEQKGAAG